MLNLKRFKGKSGATNQLAIASDAADLRPTGPLGYDESFSYFAHDPVNLKCLQGGRLPFQFGTPSGQDSLLSRLRWLTVRLGSNLLDRRFPLLELHGSIP